ncbi:hypothetical protein IE53DRAFT_369646 [Violaceomyces palustris]|uniref:Uncharacterized protein n=1 Tax=Violaceomyces palustris TaxID=1673888 RepID=A0ACD0NUV6_9BASI|nr:hypothetical protein IE53DRAFT_369646 [Violaceomyces palustris]
MDSFTFHSIQFEELAPNHPATLHHQPVSPSSVFEVDDPRSIIYLLDDDDDDDEFQDIHTALARARAIILSDDDHRQQLQPRLELEEELITHAIGRRILSISGYEIQDLWYQPHFQDSHLTSIGYSSLSILPRYHLGYPHIIPAGRRHLFLPHHQHHSKPSNPYQPKAQPRPTQAAALQPPIHQPRQVEEEEVEEEEEEEDQDEHELEWLASELLSHRHPKEPASFWVIDSGDNVKGSSFTPIPTPEVVEYEEDEQRKSERIARILAEASLLQSQSESNVEEEPNQPAAATAAKTPPNASQGEAQGKGVQKKEGKSKLEGVSTATSSLRSHLETRKASVLDEEEEEILEKEGIAVEHQEDEDEEDEVGQEETNEKRGLAVNAADLSALKRPAKVVKVFDTRERGSSNSS